MGNQQKIITVVGGTGFIGRYVVKLLAEAGYRIRVIARRPDRAAFLKTSGDVGQISLEAGNIGIAESLQGKLEGSYAVVNLVGILFEAGQQNFAALHAQGSERLAKLAKSAGAQKFIQVSSLGVDKSLKSKYSRTKANGEKAVLAAFADATILRPSVVFGPEDGFFNKFASMASLSPALPLVGGGKTRFQPVYVMDVARAIVASIENDTAKGNTYELGGPTIYSFKELMQVMLKTTGQKRCLISLPTAVASGMGLVFDMLPFLKWLPVLENAALSRDQVRLLEYDNVVSPDALRFSDLGISPTALEVIVPSYLERFSKTTTLN